jgi:hypothetical protein
MASIACVPSGMLAHLGRERERERDNGQQAGGHTLGWRWPGQAAATTGPPLRVLRYDWSSVYQALTRLIATPRPTHGSAATGR